MNCADLTSLYHFILSRTLPTSPSTFTCIRILSNDGLGPSCSKMLGQTPTLTQRQLAPGWPSICISIKARSGLTTRPTRIHTSTSSPVATLAPPRLRSTRILFPSLLSTPRTFYRSLSTRASVKDSPAVVSPPAAPAPPALAPDQAQLLTELHVGDVYALGVPGVDSPAALATALDTDLSSGLDGTDADSLAARAARYGTNAVAAPPRLHFGSFLSKL